MTYNPLEMPASAPLRLLSAAPVRGASVTEDASAADAAEEISEESSADVTADDEVADDETDDDKVPADEVSAAEPDDEVSEDKVSGDESAETEREETSVPASADTATGVPVAAIVNDKRRHTAIFRIFSFCIQCSPRFFTQSKTKAAPQH